MKPSMDIGFRVLAAFVGGYLLTALFNLVWVLWWPGHRADAVFYGVLLPWVVYCLVMIWAFAARNALRAWGWIILVALMLTVLLGLARWLK
ncbi:iron transporter [Methylobacillus methanolivorans]